MQPRITIVTPYYQKSEGILRTAAMSILAQVGAPAWHWVIVDDSSPVPARRELADILTAHPDRITIVEQPNGGPAAARNRGLDHVPAGTEFVAFLDSDDTWTEDHLANAATALDAGYDFYFSDHFQLHQTTVSAFNRAGRIQPDQHPPLAANQDLRAYSGDMFDQVLRCNVISTSTAVYRYAKFPDKRFREEFVYAGEDYLFWMGLARTTNRIAFSRRVESSCGEGINVFAGSDWGTERSLIRLHHEMRYRKAVPQLFTLTPDQAAHNEQVVRRLRRSFVADVIHRITHHKPLNGLLAKQFKIDAPSLFYFLPLAISVAMHR